MIIPVGSALWITEYHFTGDSEAMITTAGLNVSAWGGAYDQGLTNVAAAWKTAVLPQMSNEVTVGPSHLRVAISDSDPQVFTDSTATVGSTSDFPLWPNTAVLVQKRSGFGGKRNRGRLYLPGMAFRAGITPAGLISPLIVEALQDRLDDFLLALSEMTEPGITAMQILHSEVPATPTTVLELPVQARLATQRQRLRP